MEYEHSEHEFYPENLNLHLPHLVQFKRPDFTFRPSGGRRCTRASTPGQRLVFDRDL